jgi:hypothetical protein
MNDGRGSRQRCAALVILAAGLLAMTANCRRTKPPHELALLLQEVDETTPTGQTRVRCKFTETRRDELAQKDGEAVHFTVDNQCGAAKWVGIRYEGNLPLEGCPVRQFPLLGWRQFPPGRKDAGTCSIPMNEIHCHVLEILVRSSKNELTPFAVPSPIASRDDCPKTGIKDHSLEFHDIPP